MIGIYKITSPSGRVYVGQAVNIEKRWRYYNKVVCKGQTRLYNSFVKYGVDKHIFEVLEECLEESLNIRERYWQEYYNTVESGLNLKLTKTKDKSGRLSKETKKKIGESNSIALTGKILSEETKNKIGEGNKGKVVAEEVKAKMSSNSAKYWKGKTFSEEHKTNIQKGRQGYKHSEETIEKIRQSHLGKQHTEETKQKLAEQRRGKSSGAKGRTHSEETKQRLREINTGKKHSEEAINKIKKAGLGRKVTEETKEKMRQAKLDTPLEKVKCTYCDVTSYPRIMKRWHFDNCKNKLAKHR
jgi:hypothetical protein